MPVSSRLAALAEDLGPLRQQAPLGTLRRSLGYSAGAMSRSQITDYVRPESLGEVWSRMASEGRSVRLLGGGSDLTIACPPEVTTFMDLSQAVPGTIEVDADGSITIGAMATLTDFVENAAIADHASGVVADMMVHVGSPLLRNTATLGGHLARGKLSDIIPVFLALDAEVTIYTGEPHTMALATYYDDAINKQPHILTAVRLPPLPHSKAAFLRLSRTAFDFPIINACCRLDFADNQIADARIVLGATPLPAQRARASEAALITAGITADGIAAASEAARAEITTKGGWTASAEYRTHLVGVLVERCLRQVADGDAA